MERKKYWCCPSHPAAGVFPVTNVKKTHTHTQKTNNYNTLKSGFKP